MYLTQKNPNIVTNNTNFPTYSSPKYSRMTLFKPKSMKRILQKALVEIVFKFWPLLINSDVVTISCLKTWLKYFTSSRIECI